VPTHRVAVLVLLVAVLLILRILCGRLLQLRLRLGCAVGRRDGIGLEHGAGGLLRLRGRVGARGGGHVAAVEEGVVVVAVHGCCGVEGADGSREGGSLRGAASLRRRLEACEG
jgi:hypothetical protein